MKIPKRLLLKLLVLVLCGYGVFTTMRIHQLETRLSALESEQRTDAPISYEFDDSFVEYFGSEGVNSAYRVMRLGGTDPDQILREVTRELKSP